MKLNIASVVCFALMLMNFDGTLAASKRHHARRTQATAGAFDYYVLSLSWAPEFCASHGSAGSGRECDPSRHTGFIVHGLWPQAEGSRVENCGNVSPVSQSIVNLMLPLMTSAGLIQHEWQTHGSCSGLSADDYFALIRKDYAKVHVPAEFSGHQQQQKSTASIEQDFAAASGLAGASSVRVACSGSQLTEVRLCLTKDGQSRACSASVGECNAGSVTILPVP